MDGQNKKAFELAAEVHKQLITLAIAIITVTVALAKDLFPPNERVALLLKLGWVSYLVSVAGGVAALAGLTGQLAKAPTPDVYAKPVKHSALLQYGAFLVGTLLLIIFGMCLQIAPNTKAP